MFDDVSGMAALHAGTFRESVRDAFGASIVADVLDPALKEINSLRVFHDSARKQLLNIDQILTEARTIQIKESGWT